MTQKNKLIINLERNKAQTYTVSINDLFTTDLKENCPIFSYSIVKVINEITGESIPLTDYSSLFIVDS